MSRFAHEHPISKLALAPVFLEVVASFWGRALYSPFRGEKGASTYRRDVSYAILRTILSGFSSAEGQYLSASTDRVYHGVSRANHWTPDVVDLGGGAKGNWIGPRDAKFVMIYMHGGGYIGYATPGHMKYQFELRQEINAQGHDMSILSLTYSLAPKARYPAQLAQAAAALKYLLDDEKRDPSTILLGGDSAGGNLAVALLSHLAHPHPDASVPRIDLTQYSRRRHGARLHSAVLISPWVSFAFDSPSFASYAECDYITVSALQRATDAFVPPAAPLDEYNEPFRAAPEWWQGVAERAVREVFIWGGGSEILLDGIVEFARRVQQGFALADAAVGGAGADADAPKDEDARADAGSGQGASTVRPRTVGKDRVKLVVTPKSAHEEMIIDKLLRITEKHEGGQAIQEWMMARL